MKQTTFWMNWFTVIIMIVGGITSGVGLYNILSPEIPTESMPIILSRNTAGPIGLLFSLTFLFIISGVGNEHARMTREIGELKGEIKIQAQRIKDLEDKLQEENG